jgi:hypothetical protein
MLALGNQGTGIQELKFLLQKILSDPILDQSNSHRDSFLFFPPIPVLNYDVGARPRLLSHGVTTIRIA